MASTTRLPHRRDHRSRVDDDLVDRLRDIFRRPTGTSSAGYPYLERHAWELFRDRIPHLFRRGLTVFRRVEQLEEATDSENVRRACGVARQVLKTAAITAPTDLWLLRHVLGYWHEIGLGERLLDGAALYPADCRVEVDGRVRTLEATELERDAHFLLSRGLLEQYDTSFRIAGHPRVRRIFEEIGAVPEAASIPMTGPWRRLLGDGSPEEADRRAVNALRRRPRPAPAHPHDHWVPTVEEIEVGYRLVPLVLGLKVAGPLDGLDRGEVVTTERLSDRHPQAASAALSILRDAGWLDETGGELRVTVLGARGFSRGPGPFGIIEAYHGYMRRGAELLLGEGEDVWVDRGDNVAASQAANRKTFRQANDALDRLCRETGFDYEVFIEHAIGQGEATRQRYERSGEALTYFGADLEDAAIDAARGEQRAGRLPDEMVFVRRADIGQPDILLEAMAAHGADPHGAVMMVGNGFHEIRGAAGDEMVDVFRAYHEAGILLFFTEANALTIDDLRATAWNTYHAGFMYLHEKSGQNLRPARPRRHPRLGRQLRKAWSECALEAGYVRAEAYCRRSRTIYPYTRDDGHNPSISVNHVFVPAGIAEELGIEE